MHGREDQAAEIARDDGIVLEGKDNDSSGSDNEKSHIPGAQPAGVNVGDLKPKGL